MNNHIRIYFVETGDTIISTDAPHSLDYTQVIALQQAYVNAYNGREIAVTQTQGYSTTERAPEVATYSKLLDDTLNRINEYGVI